MNINNLPASNITEAKGAAGVAVAEPPPKPAAKPAPAKASEPKAPEAKKPEAGPATAAAKASEKAGEKPEITDVKPTGEQTAEGEPTFTLKVNGQEYKATQGEIIALAQKAKAADAALKQKAEIEQMAANLLTSLDSDTLSLLVKRHGKEKAKEMVIAMTRSLIAEEAKTPEQIELEELRASKKTQEEAEAAAKKQKEQEEYRAKQRVLYTQMLQEIDKELNETHLPKDKLTLTRVLNYLAAGKKANGTAWTVRDAVKAVEVEDMGHATYYARRYAEGKLPSEKFREIFGDDALKKLNKEQITLLKNADKSARNEQPSNGNGAAAETPKPKRSLSKGRGSDGISEREYRRQFGSLGGI